MISLTNLYYFVDGFLRAFPVALAGGVIGIISYLYLTGEFSEDKEGGKDVNDS